jgi:hypothetical protein
MDQESTSAINREHIHQYALVHIRIMNARRNVMDTITAIMHLNATAEMAPRYCKIITAMRTDHIGVVDVEENESWERL